MMEIFVATDFSKHSRSALRWGAFLAEQIDASLTVGHVVDLAGEDHIWSSLLKSPGELESSALENTREELEKFYAQYAIDGPDEVEFFTARGKPEEELIKAVKTREDAVLVIGSRGKTDTQDIPFGNTARRMVRSSPRPVILVPPTVEMQPLERLVVGVDASSPSREAIRWAGRFGRSQNAQVYAVYGYELPENSTVEAAMLPDVEDYDQLIDKKRRSIMDLVDTAGATDTITDVLMIEKPAERAIVDTADDNQAAMIFVGTHGREGVKRFLLGNTAERVIRRSACPVFVAPAVLQEPDETENH